MIKKTSCSVGSVVNHFLLIFFAFLCVLPFYYVLMVSLSDPAMVRMGEITIFPRGFSLDAYKMVLRQKIFFNAFRVTVLRTVIGTVFALFIQTTMSYALAQKRLKGKKFFTLMVIFTILFNGGIIPTYLIVRYTGLLDTLFALIIPPAVNAFNVIILISFFSSIPESLEESARIDGANDFTVFARIYLPLSLPALATITLFVAVFHWNSLMDGVLYINKSVLKPLQVYLMDLVSRATAVDMYQDSDEYAVPFLSIQTTAIFVSTLPILVVYPFIQRHFVKGVMIGAIKG